MWRATKTTSAYLATILALFCFSTDSFGIQTGTPQASGGGSATSQPVGAAPQSLPSNPTSVATSAPSTPRVRFVPVLISATDGSGNPVSGLTKEQLTIMDTNQIVSPLQVLKAADIPLHLGIVLLSTPATFSQQRAAATDLVSKAIRPGVDEAFVVTARGKKPWPSDRLDWKQDPTELMKVIGGLDPHAGLPDAFNFNLETDETGLDENAGRNTIQTFGGNRVNVFDVVFSMMNSDPRPSRRVLVIFREPWSHSPGFGVRANHAVEGRLLRVVAVAQQLHMTVFVIGLEDLKFSGIADNNIGKVYTSLHAGEDGGAGAASREYDRQMERDRIRAYEAGKINIQRIASETGGTTFWSTKKNYSDAINGIAHQLAGQYIVTFTPRDIPGPAHTLKVTSNSGTHVLAQTAFSF